MSAAAPASSAAASAPATMPVTSASAKFVAPGTTVRKLGYLTKLGGGEGGRKSWKKRFFVLTDNLAYYKDEASYQTGKEPLNIITLNAYYVSKIPESKKFEFTVHAYPKSLTCQAENEEDLQSWMGILLAPLDGYVG